MVTLCFNLLMPTKSSNKLPQWLIPLGFYLKQIRTAFLQNSISPKYIFELFPQLFKFRYTTLKIVSNQSLAPPYSVREKFLRSMMVLVAWLDCMVSHDRPYFYICFYQISNLTLCYFF